MYQVYVNKISLKPNKYHFSNQMIKSMENMKDENGGIIRDELKKFLYASVRITDLNYGGMEYKEDNLNYMFVLSDMFGQLTCREFMQMFPIDKRYDGKKYQCKDYYNAIDKINEIGIDNVIGDKFFELIMHYSNPYTDNLAVEFMMQLTHREESLGHKTPFDELFGDCKKEYLLPNGDFVDEDGNVVGHVIKEKRKPTMVI